ncbi:phosphate ABC transporter substrate-binding protein [Feifania hominis]|nr:phosphate ABC transporter substrate-binding protein [Feifania hominis]
MLSILLAAVLVLAVFAGCAPKSEDPGTTDPGTTDPGTTDPGTTDPGTSDESAKLAVVGSTSVGPLMEKFVAGYSKVKPNVEIEVTQVGSGAGITAAVDGTADIGMSSRDLKDEEVQKGLVPTSIAIDAIAVVVHPDNKVENLTVDQIQKIFSGEITNWKDVGGEDKAITVVSREEGSGTRSAFEELVGLQREVEKDGQKLTESLLSDKAVTSEGTGAVKATVAGNPQAIGYISLGMMESSVKAVSVDGVACSVEDVVAGTYKISRPFLLVTKGEATGAAKEFIEYILSDEAQALVEENGYIKIQ